MMDLPCDTLTDFPALQHITQEFFITFISLLLNLIAYSANSFPYNLVIQVTWGHHPENYFTRAVYETDEETWAK